MYVLMYHVQQPPPAPHLLLLSAWRYDTISILASALIVSINRMWPTSVILSAAVILAASSVSASNDPRECEGEIPIAKFRSA